MAFIFDQKHFIVYNDDAAMNSATVLTGMTSTAAQDTNFYDIDTDVKSVFRIRFEVANTGDAAANITRRLEFREDSGAWTQITTGTNNVRLYNSTNFADGAATTQKLTGVGTFTAGKGKDTASDTTQISLTNGYNVEDEWCLQFQSTAQTHSYQFRVTNAGTALTTYTVTPTISPIRWGTVADRVYYDASKFLNPTVYFEGNFWSSVAAYPVYLRLINVTDGSTVVVNSKIGGLASSITRFRSEPLVLVSQKEYLFQYGVAHGATLNNLRGGWAG